MAWQRVDPRGDVLDTRQSAIDIYRVPEFPFFLLSTHFSFSKGRGWALGSPQGVAPRRVAALHTPNQIVSLFI
jgi:hypothetical protein